MLFDNDPGVIKLQEELAQAQQTIEKLEEKIVPKKKYQELQQQLRDINAT